MGEPGPGSPDQRPYTARALRAAKPRLARRRRRRLCRLRRSQVGAAEPEAAHLVLQRAGERVEDGARVLHRGGGVEGLAASRLDVAEERDETMTLGGLAIHGVLDVVHQRERAVGGDGDLSRGALLL